MTDELAKKRMEYKKLLDESVKKIVQDLSGKVKKISVFGSYAREKADLFTDLDILIIADSDKPFIERLKEIYSFLSLPVDADILWYTPDEIAKIKHRGFIKKILQEEVVLYEE